MITCSPVSLCSLPYRFLSSVFFPFVNPEIVPKIDLQFSSMGDAPVVAPQIDFSSPLYLHPSENAGSILLPAVFYGTGYRSWRRAVLRALSVKSKIGFITGKVVKPASTDPSFAQIR